MYTNEYRHALSVALGSLAEHETQVEASLTVSLLQPEQAALLSSRCENVGKMLQGLKAALNRHGSSWSPAPNLQALSPMTELAGFLILSAALLYSFDLRRYPTKTDDAVTFGLVVSQNVNRNGTMLVQPVFELMYFSGTPVGMGGSISVALGGRIEGGPILAVAPAIAYKGSQFLFGVSLIVVS